MLVAYHLAVRLAATPRGERCATDAAWRGSFRRSDATATDASSTYPIGVREGDRRPRGSRDRRSEPHLRRARERLRPSWTSPCATWGLRPRPARWPRPACRGAG